MVDRRPDTGALANKTLGLSRRDSRAVVHQLEQRLEHELEERQPAESHRETLARIEAESYAKIMSRNAAKLYDFDLDQLASKRIPAAAP